MSIYSGFREKWRVVAVAADDAREYDADARYASMFRAADEAGLVLLSKDEVAAYQSALIKQMRGNASCG